MDHRKRNVLILYASAGHGHEKAARAVAEALGGSVPDAEIRLADVLTLTPGLFGRGYRETYLFLIRRLPWLWGFFYDLFDRPGVYALIAPLRRFVNGLAASRLEARLLSEKPDVVVSTHFLATEVAGYLKQHGKIGSYLVTVVTDYLPHFFWVHKNVDCFIAALSETKAGLERRGVPAEKIRILGIPVEKKFTTRRSKETAAASIGIRPDVFTVLFTSGGAGIGSVGMILERIFESGKKVQVLVVCGTNRPLFDRLSSSAAARPLLKVFGFVDNMDELMDASDLLVGKGGGLTVTEALCKEKPMVLFQSVPGQETRNASCLERRGAVLTAASGDEVAARVLEFAASPQKLEEVRRAIREVSKPSAAAEISRWVGQRWI